MKTFLLTATYLVGLGELALAVFFWVTHSKSEIRKVMALLTLSTGIWAITNGLTSYVNYSRWVELNLVILFIAGLFIVSSLLHISIIFPHRVFTFDKLHAFLIYLPAIIFSIILSSTNTVVKSYAVATDNAGTVIPGPLFIFFQILVALLFLTSVGILCFKLRRQDGLNKQYTALFFIGIVLGGLPAIVLNLLFALFAFYTNPLWAVIFSVFWIGFITYIVVKK